MDSLRRLPRAARVGIASTQHRRGRASYHGTSPADQYAFTFAAANEALCPRFWETWKCRNGTLRGRRQKPEAFTGVAAIPASQARVASDRTPAAGVKRLSSFLWDGPFGCSHVLVRCSVFFVLVVMPSSAVLRLPPGMYKHIIYETFLNVVIVLLAVRGWRAHLAFVPIWLALLWFLWPTWPRH